MKWGLRQKFLFYYSFYCSNWKIFIEHLLLKILDELFAQKIAKWLHQSPFVYISYDFEVTFESSVAIKVYVSKIRSVIQSTPDNSNPR